MNYKKRIRKIQNKLKYNSVFYVTDPSDIFYLSGFEGTFSKIVISKKSSYFITDPRYDGVSEKLGIEKIYVSLVTKDFKADLKNIFSGKNEILMSETSSLSDYLLVKKLRKRSVFSGIIAELRMIKDDEEIMRIKKAITIAQKGILHVASILKPEISEKDLANEFEHYIKKLGAESLSFSSIIAFNSNSSVPHSVTSGRKLGKKSLILIDCGVKYKGYCSDLTRVITFGIIGNHLNEIKKHYEIVRKAKNLSAPEYKKGALIRKADEKARIFLKNYGLDTFFTHSLGHSMGIDVHEPPYANRLEKSVSKPGMIFTCEPGVYFKGKYGIRIEDDYLVTKKGVIKLSTLSDKLIIR